jgi:predicted ribosomally synthesized peptide with SipW-like signal peptide
MQKSILVSLVTIGLLASVIGVGTYAFFSDTETSSGNTITAGTLDLSVNDLNPLSGSLITIGDMKPSFQKLSPVITLRVVDNPGKLYKMIHVVDCKTNTITEPEGKWIVANGADRDDLYNVIWFDLSVKNDGADWTPLITYDNQVKLADVLDKWIYLGTVDQGKPFKLNQSFHMDSGTGNWAQSDICTFDESFMVLQTNADEPTPKY